jgi:uridine phosphorylase
MEVCHLNLKPEHIAHNIIFRGRSKSCGKITQFFDSIDFPLKREFKTKQDYSKARELV